MERAVKIVALDRMFELIELITYLYVATACRVGCTYVCMYVEGPLTTVSMEREGAVSAMGRATIWSPSSQPCEYEPLTTHHQHTNPAP